MDVRIDAQAAMPRTAGLRAAGASHVGLLLRRILLIVVAAALVIVGALTADHVEAAGSPEHSVIAGAVAGPLDAAAALPPPTLFGTTAEPGVGVAGELVLLTCSILALLVLLLPALRPGPVDGAMHRIATGSSALVALARQAWTDADRPDRTALCIIRT